MAYDTAAARGERRAEWGLFLGWLAVGACLVLGTAALLSVGPVLIALAAAGTLLLLRAGRRHAAAGALTGAALPLFLLAGLNRGGPGTVCHAVPGGQTCADTYAPMPFLAAGLLLCAAGLLLFRVLVRRRRAAG
ncbi:hypothetical protein [Streptomyces tropicalis]|uniref:Integral membrane protein n=1 Tax=Streptomyces tropicalis TaxID=3034234 RepID=A0ABT5ZXY0_9ACTN|nr:hypothetical protein [Streptomyces tropicalis]MDF3297238.1 hypothetical protein [Streptomyces tropicalis]